MALFTRPDEDPLMGLAKAAAPLVGIMGWATVAVGLSVDGGVWVAGLGLITTALAERWRWPTLVGEAVLLSAAVTVCQPDRRDWIWVGLALIGLGRVTGIAVARLRARAGE